MDKPTPSTSVRHNDGLSEALINSYSRWMDGDTFQQSTVEEEGIPALKKREDLDDGTTKDPKANAGPPDPAANLRTGQGMKYSLGAQIKDTTKVATETVSFELDGATYIFEVKMDGKDDNGNTSCWKGYKKQGTKKKGGKEVNNCVKEYFEKDSKSGKMVKKHNCAKKCKKEGLEYDVVPGEHTMLEDGTVTHYDIMRERIKFSTTFLSKNLRS